jgi:hypothetical protein
MELTNHHIRKMIVGLSIRERGGLLSPAHCTAACGLIE